MPYLPQRAIRGMGLFHASKSSHWRIYTNLLLSYLKHAHTTTYVELLVADTGI